MKNHHRQYWVTACVVISILSTHERTLAQGVNASAKIMKDPHNYEHAYLPVGAYKTGAYLFRDLFKTDSLSHEVRFLENETFEVTSFKELEAFRNKIYSTSEDTIEAFEIKYGLRKWNGRYKPVNIYVPLRMVITATSPDSVSITYGVPNGGSGTLAVNDYYILDAKKFIALRQDSATLWVNNYRTLIRIDEKNIGAFRRFNAGATEDATGQIFAFKEAEDFFEPADDIYLTSWANIDLRNGISTFRHSVAMANGIYTGNLSSAHAADLGTMCPPNCLKMIFRAGRSEGKSIFNHTPKEKISDPKFERPLTWILITIGCLLIGFIIGRLAKRK